MEQEQGFFYIIPAELAEGGESTKALLYGVISSFCKIFKGERKGCRAGNAFLAKKLKKRDTSIIRTYLTELEKENWIYIKNRGGRNREIFINVGPNVWKKPRLGVEKSTGQRVEKSTLSNINTSSINSNCVASATDGVENKNLEEKKDRPMNLDQFVKWCLASTQAHIKIIGEWAETTKPQFDTVEQWEAYIKRHLRPARSLVPFSHEQLEAGFQRIREAKYLDTVTLETLFKFITNTKIK